MDINSIHENFIKRDCVIGGDECVLVYPPEEGIVWTEENLCHRSVIFCKEDGFVISAGFNKFFNLNEREDIKPWNPDWPIQARYKVDGSLLILSKYKGEIIARTRETTSVRSLGNGREFDLLLEKYKTFFECKSWEDNYISILCEWTTPSNIICLREHEEPTLTLIGVINMHDFTYHKQDSLDLYAKHWGLERPKSYSYPSLKECIDDVRAWKNKEGVVLYSPDGQTLRKIKSDHYLFLHKAKSQLSKNKLIDLYLEHKFPTEQDFYDFILTNYDYELALYCHSTIKKIFSFLSEHYKARAKVADFCEKIKNLTQREKADDINSHYKDWRKPYAFSYLNNRDELGESAMRRLLREALK